MRWRAAIVALLLLGGTVGALLAVFAAESRREYRPEVTVLLAELAPGDADEELVRARAMTAWEQSSPLFREAVLRDRFVDMMDRINRTLGSFRGILNVTRVEERDSRHGQTARIELELEFERSRTTGEVSLHRRLPDREWRLLGLRVAIPEPLRDKAAALEAEYDRTRAPPEVLELAREVLERVRDGEGRRVYEEASDQFRDSVVSADRFEELLGAQREALGPYRRILAVLSSAQKPDKSRARIYALLEFEKDNTTGTFEFIKAGGEAPRGETWLLAFYKIILPEPDLPTRE